jgi:ankyrin repeat protein
LSKNADINLKASNDSTPLHWAAGSGFVLLNGLLTFVGNLEMTQLLVNHGANIHATTNTWYTDSVFGKSSGQTGKFRAFNY